MSASLIKGFDPDTGSHVNVSVDATYKTLRIENWVFDDNDIPVRMTQPTISSDVINVELRTANLENIMIDMSNTMQLMRKQLELMIVFMQGITGSGLTTNDIEEV